MAKNEDLCLEKKANIMMDVQVCVCVFVCLCCALLLCLCLNGCFAFVFLTSEGIFQPCLLSPVPKTVELPYVSRETNRLLCVSLNY